MFNAFFMAHFIWDSIPVWKHSNWRNDHIWDIWPFGKNVKSHKKPSSTRSSSIFLPDLKKNPKNQMLFKQKIISTYFCRFSPSFHLASMIVVTSSIQESRGARDLKRFCYKNCKWAKYKSTGEPWGEGPENIFIQKCKNATQNTKAEERRRRAT